MLKLLRARQILFDTRELRPRPQLDDKVLTAWNGLMIAAFRVPRACSAAARSARTTPESTAAHLRPANAASFIRGIDDAGSRTLLRRYRAGGGHRCMPRTMPA